MITSRVLAHTALKLTQEENAEASLDAFMSYINENNLNGLLPQMQAHIKRMSAQLSEAEVLHVTTKHALSESDLNEIISIAGADSDTQIIQHTDDSVIGGFSATYKGHIYDGSLQAQVSQLRNVLTR